MNIGGNTLKNLKLLWRNNLTAKLSLIFLPRLISLKKVFRPGSAVVMATPEALINVVWQVFVLVFVGLFYLFYFRFDMNKSAWVALLCNIATVIVNFFQSYTF